MVCPPGLERVGKVLPESSILTVQVLELQEIPLEDLFTVKAYDALDDEYSLVARDVAMMEVVPAATSVMVPSDAIEATLASLDV